MRKKARRSIPNTKEISLYLHCCQCLIEVAEHQEPIEQRLEVGWTELGIQVWCRRHDINVLHVDFEGQRHPTNITGIGGKAFTKKHQQELRKLKGGVAL